MLALVVRLLPPRLTLAYARRLRRAGKLQRALGAVDIAARKLRWRAPTSAATLSEAMVLRGALLFALGYESEAIAALIDGQAALAGEPQAHAFLVRTLLRRQTLDASALPAVVQYVNRRPSSESREAFDENLRRLKTLARPRTGADVRSINSAIALARPDLPWPHLHLGILELAAGNHRRAALAIRQSADSDAREPPAALSALRSAHGEQLQQLARTE